MPVHSGPEAKRHYFDVEQLDPRDLWRDLPAFKVLVQEADVKEVMCAYQRFEENPVAGANACFIKSCAMNGDLNMWW